MWYIYFDLEFNNLV